MANNKRIEWIDIAKGILIMLVILGHIIENNENNLQNWIYSFHMPAFFVLEGILIGKQVKRIDKIKDYYLRSINSLLYPYVVFTLILLLRIILQVVAGLTRSDEFVDYLFLSISTCGVGVLWFLPTFFYAKILFYCLYTKKINSLFVPVFIITLVVWFLFKSYISLNDNNEFNIFSLVALAVRSVVGTGFIYLGYGIEVLQKKHHIHPIFGFIALVISVIVFRFNGTVDLNKTVFNNLFLYFVIAIMGSVGIISISIFVSNFKIATIFTYFGRNSLIIMLTHSIFYIFKTVRFAINKVPGLKYSNAVIIILTFVFTMCIEVILIELINRKLKFLIKNPFSKKWVGGHEV